MPTDNTKWIYLYLLMWTVIAVVAATTTFIAMGSKSLGQWGYFVYSMLVYFYVWGVLAFMIYRFVVREPSSRRSLPVTIGMHLVLLVAITISLAFIVHPVNWREWLMGSHATGFHSLNAFIYSFVLVGSLTLRYFQVSREREKDAVVAELRSFELQKDLSQARVDALRNQINPHFLFNTLNAIASLIETSNNREAAKVTGLLGALLRTALEETNTVFLPLDKEIEFLQRYVDIEQIRFGDKFVFEQDIGRNCRDLPVPSLFLQPIVENAVKYAVSPASAPVTVRLVVRRDADWISISICDDGPGLSAEQNPRGLGLSNVRERLALLYGGQASLAINNNSSHGVTVEIKLPVEPEALPEAAVTGAPAPQSRRQVLNPGSLPLPSDR